MKTGSFDHDAVMVGSLSNGLAVAILLQQNGLSVLLVKGDDKIGYYAANVH
jgi:phytoene dehydrogenase-like protein